MVAKGRQSFGSAETAPSVVFGFSTDNGKVPEGRSTDKDNRPAPASPYTLLQGQATNCQTFEMARAQAPPRDADDGTNPATELLKAASVFFSKMYESFEKKTGQNAKTEEFEIEARDERPAKLHGNLSENSILRADISSERERNVDAEEMVDLRKQGCEDLVGKPSGEGMLEKNNNPPKEVVPQAELTPYDHHEDDGMPVVDSTQAVDSVEVGLPASTKSRGGRSLSLSKSKSKLANIHKAPLSSDVTEELLEAGVKSEEKERNDADAEEMVDLRNQGCEDRVGKPSVEGMLEKDNDPQKELVPQEELLTYDHHEDDGMPVVDSTKAVESVEVGLPASTKSRGGWSLPLSERKLKLANMNNDPLSAEATEVLLEAGGKSNDTPSTKNKLPRFGLLSGMGRSKGKVIPPTEGGAEPGKAENGESEGSNEKRERSLSSSGLSVCWDSHGRAREDHCNKNDDGGCEDSNEKKKSSLSQSRISLRWASHRHARQDLPMKQFDGKLEDSHEKKERSSSPSRLSIRWASRGRTEGRDRQEQSSSVGKERSRNRPGWMSMPDTKYIDGAEEKDKYNGHTESERDELSSNKTKSSLAKESSKIPRWASLGLSPRKKEKKEGFFVDSQEEKVEDEGNAEVESNRDTEEPLSAQQKTRMNGHKESERDELSSNKTKSSLTKESSKIPRWAALGLSPRKKEEKEDFSEDSQEEKVDDEQNAEVESSRDTEELLSAQQKTRMNGKPSFNKKVSLPRWSTRSKVVKADADGDMLWQTSKVGIKSPRWISPGRSRENSPPLVDQQDCEKTFESGEGKNNKEAKLSRWIPPGRQREKRSSVADKKDCEKPTTIGDASRDNAKPREEGIPSPAKEHHAKLLGRRISRLVPPKQNRVTNQSDDDEFDQKAVVIDAMKLVDIAEKLGLSIKELADRLESGGLGFLERQISGKIPVEEDVEVKREAEECVKVKEEAEERAEVIGEPEKGIEVKAEVEKGVDAKEEEVEKGVEAEEEEVEEVEKGVEMREKVENAVKVKEVVVKKGAEVKNEVDTVLGAPALDTAVEDRSQVRNSTKNPNTNHRESPKPPVIQKSTGRSTPELAQNNSRTTLDSQKRKGRQSPQVMESKGESAESSHFEEGSALWSEKAVNGKQSRDASFAADDSPISLELPLTINTHVKETYDKIEAKRKKKTVASWESGGKAVLKGKDGVNHEAIQLQPRPTEEQWRPEVHSQSHEVIQFGHRPTEEQRRKKHTSSRTAMSHRAKEKGLPPPPPPPPPQLPAKSKREKKTAKPSDKSAQPGPKAVYPEEQGAGGEEDHRDGSEPLKEWTDRLANCSKVPACLNKQGSEGMDNNSIVSDGKAPAHDLKNRKDQEPPERWTKCLVQCDDTPLFLNQQGSACMGNSSNAGDEKVPSGIRSGTEKASPAEELPILEKEERKTATEETAVETTMLRKKKASQSVANPAPSNSAESCEGSSLGSGKKSKETGHVSYKDPLVSSDKFGAEASSPVKETRGSSRQLKQLSATKKNQRMTKGPAPPQPDKLGREQSDSSTGSSSVPSCHRGRKSERMGYIKKRFVSTRGTKPLKKEDQQQPEEPEPFLETESREEEERHVVQSRSNTTDDPQSSSASMASQTNSGSYSSSGGGPSDYEPRTMFSQLGKYVAEAMGTNFSVGNGTDLGDDDEFRSFTNESSSLVSFPEDPGVSFGSAESSYDYSVHGKKTDASSSRDLSDTDPYDSAGELVS